MRSRVLWTYILAAVLAAFAAVSTARAMDSGESSRLREEVQRLLKQERFSEASDILARLHGAFPADRRLLFDYVATLSWADRHEEAAKYAKDFLTLRPPMYSLSSAALSFRRVGNVDMAMKLYQEGQRRYPDEPGFVIGEILTDVDAGRFDEARHRLDIFKKRDGVEKDLADAERYLAAKRGEAEFRRRWDNAVLLAREGQHQAALDELARLRSERPDETKLVYDVVTVLTWAGRYGEAAAEAQRLDLAAAPEWLRRTAAFSLRESGDLAGAERMYRALLEENPDDLESAEALAVALARAKKVKEAEALVERYGDRFSSATRGDLANILAGLRQDEAGLLARDEKYEAALARLDELKKKYPGRTSADWDRLAVLSWTGDHEGAAELAGRLNLAPAPEYVRRAAALSLRESGKYAPAEKLYAAILKKNPKDDELAAALALTQIRAGKVDAAEKTLAGRSNAASAEAVKALADAVDAVVKARRDKAGALAQADKLSEALAILRPLRAKYPNRKELTWDLLAILSWNNNHKEAAALADEAGRALDDAPEYAGNAAAVSYREVGRLDDSEKIYRRILAARPDDVSAADGLAATLQQAGKLDEAEAVVRRYMKDAPEKMTAREREIASLHRHRAGELAKAEKYDDALAILNPLIARHPGNDALVHDKIAILSWADRHKEAVEASRAIAADKAPEYVLANLAGSYRKSDDLSGAKALYEAGLARFPRNVDLAVGYALTLAGMDRGEDALKVLRDFSARHPDVATGPRGGEIKETMWRIDPPPIYTPPPRPDAPYRKEQDAIVELARGGKTEAASKRMAELVRQHPDDVYLLGDYIVILNWNRENDEAILLLPRLDLKLAHDYVVAAGARALMARNHHYDAHMFIEKTIAAQLGNPELLAQAAVMVANGGDLRKAREYLEKTEASKAPGILNRIKEARLAIGMDSVDNLEHLLQSLNNPPTTPEERVKHLERLRALGADSLVRDVRERMDEDGVDTPETQSPEAYMRRLEDIRVGAVRRGAWGEKTPHPRDTAIREAHFVSALHDLDAMQAAMPITATTEQWASVGIAKLKVFYELNMFEEALAEFAAVRDCGVRIDDGSLLAAAGSYLGLKTPRMAGKLYREIIARQFEPKPPLPDDLYQAKKGLYWSLLESEQLRCSLAHAETLYNEGVAPHGGDPLYPNNDWRKMDVTVTRGLSYLYAGFAAEAYRQLSGLAADAPANPAVLAALARVQGMRGLPRTARDTVHLAQVHAPSDIGLATQEGTLYLNYQDWRKAHRMVKATEAYTEKVASAKQLRRDWDTFNMYEFRLDVALSKVTQGSSPNAGSGAIPSIEARLFSKPICYNWRGFIGGATSGGDFQEGHARQNVLLGGVEFRSTLLNATLEARADKVRKTEFGLGLSGSYTPSDNWSFPYSFQLLSRDTPLRARYSDITADSAMLGANYYRDETFSGGLSSSYMNFSDGNQRFSVSGSLSRRLWTCYNRYIDGGLNAYTSSNSKDADRPYFNPRFDAEIGGSLSYGNLLYRHYSRSLRHYATISAGNYYQKYYGSDVVWNVSYSQALDLNDRTSLAYGVGYGRRVYDGDPERSVNAWLTAVVRF